MIAVVNEGRKLGFELECFGPLDRAQLAHVLMGNGINVYDASRHDSAAPYYVVIKGDGSIHPGTEWRYHAYELTFMAYMTATGTAWLKRLCDLLNKVGVSVNDSCGYHVHVDASDMTFEHMKSLYNLTFKYENILGGFLPVSRRTNSYAKMRGDRDRTMLANCTSMSDITRVAMDRYHGLNLYAHRAHGTIEYRYHSGTCDYDKVYSWAMLCLRMFEHAKARACNSKGKLANSPENLRNFLCAIGLKPNNRIYTSIDARLNPVRDYLVKRHWHFARMTSEYIARRRAGTQARTAPRPTASPAPLPVVAAPGLVVRTCAGCGRGRGGNNTCGAGACNSYDRWTPMGSSSRPCDNCGRSEVAGVGNGTCNDSLCSVRANSGAMLRWSRWQPIGYNTTTTGAR